MHAPEWHIIESRGREGLLGLEPQWRRLYEQTPLRTSFLSFEACLAHVDHLMQHPGQLRCLALSDGQEIRGICLLEPRKSRVLRKHRTIWGTMWHRGHSSMADLLCADDEARQAFVRVLVRHLRRDPAGHHVLALGPLPAESPLWAGLERIGRLGYASDVSELVYSLDCSRPFDEVRTSLSRKFWSNPNRSSNKLAKLPDVHYETYRGTGATRGPFETFLEVEASGWKGRARSAVRSRAADLGFFRGLSELCTDADWCEIDALYAEGRCIAAAFGTRTGVTYSGLKIGFDEAYRQVSPGQLLLERIVERCCDDPSIRQIDMVSDAPWVRGWRPQEVPLRVVHVAVARWPLFPLLAVLLQMRFGVGRRLFRWARDLRASEAARRHAGPEPTPHPAWVDDTAMRGADGRAR